MKLKDYLADCSPEQIIFLGAGANFFFVGKRYEINDNADKIDSEFKVRAKEYKRRTKIRLDFLERIGEPVMSRIETDKATGNKKVISLDILRKRYWQELEGCRRRYGIYTDYLKKYPTILDREIVDIYNKISEPGVCLILEGDEQGGYWTRKEFESGQCHKTW